MSEAIPEQIEIAPVEEPAAPAPVVEDWMPSREEWLASQQFIEQATPMLNELWNRTAPAVPEPVAPAFDPFDPNSIQAYVQSQVAAGVDQALEPFRPILGVVAQERGQDYAREALESIQGEVGEFNTDAAMLVAASLLEDPNVDPYQALRSAAEWTQNFEKQIRDEAVQNYLEDVNRVKDAPAEQKTTGTSVVENAPTHVGTGSAKYQAVVDNFLAENHPTMPVG